VSILGCNREVSWKKDGNGVRIDASTLQPGDIPGRIFTIKITDLEE
jgi:hypothetical protein